MEQGRCGSDPVTEIDLDWDGPSGVLANQKKLLRDRMF